MELHQAIDLLDVQLQNEPKVQNVERSHTDLAGVWQHDAYRAELMPAGSTGIELRLSSHGRTIHERIFANSPASVPRVAQAIIEHLTGYVS